MKVGIFLGAHQPAEGGGYTFLTELLRALERLQPTSAHDLVLCHYHSATETARSLAGFGAIDLDLHRDEVLTQQERIAIEGPPRDPWQVRVKRRLRRLIGAAAEVPPPPPPLPSWEERVYRKEGIRFLLRLAPYMDGIPLDIPFAMTVWDLQHRNSPWFPEVSSGPEWQTRERNYSELLRRASLIYTGTKRGRDEIASYYHVAPERVKVLPFGTPEFALAAAGEERRPERLSALGIQGDYLFCPGQFWPHKNQVTVLEACRIIRDRTKWDLSVVFCGADKGNLDHVRAYADRLQLGNCTKFLSFVDRSDLVELYKGAFCLAFPTFFGPDNLPPLEAFALGCPVVASDVPGAREQLGDAALLHPPADEHALADAVLSLRDAGVRERKIAAGRARSRCLTWEDHARGILASLDEFAAIRRAWH